MRILIALLLCIQLNAQNSITYDTVMQHYYSKFDTTMPTQIKSIKDFGAIGDGVANDSWAFVKASNYINSLNNTNYIFKLIIPDGTYKVGLQVKKGDTIKDPTSSLIHTYNGAASYIGKSLLTLNNCSNIIIEGQENSKIKYIDSLRFGSWNVNGTPYFPTTMPNTLNTVITSIGNCISITNCKNILLYKLSLDGNINACKLGGRWGDTGYQLNHIGVYISGKSKNILLNTINARNFCLDGFEVVQTDTTTFPTVILDKCISEFNGRQGMSWVGGKALHMYNSIFNNTGKAKFGSSPGAGLDIEPEQNKLKFGYFENCEFINNLGVGVGSDGFIYGGKSLFHTFNNCTFGGLTNWAIWMSKVPCSFNYCTFIGSIVHPSGLDSNAMQYYKHCTFTDQILINSLKSSEILAFNNTSQNINPNSVYIVNTLINADGSSYFEIDSCTVISTKSKFFFIRNGLKVKFSNNTLFYRNNTRDLAQYGYIGHIKSTTIFNNTIYNECVQDVNSIEPYKYYYIDLYGGNNSLGGNQIINCVGPAARIKWGNWSSGPCNY